MCECVCVCMYVRICACVCAHVCVYMCVYTRACFTARPNVADPLEHLGADILCVYLIISGLGPRASQVPARAGRGSAARPVSAVLPPSPGRKMSRGRVLTLKDCAPTFPKTCPLPFSSKCMMKVLNVSV